MNAEQARFLADHYVSVMQNEMPTTIKVLAAVKAGNRDYRPDEKSRSAFQLASHIAVADNWFVQSIIDGKFAFDPVASEKAEGQFKSADDIVAFYEKSFPEKLKTLRSLTGETLVRPIDFFGMMTAPAVSFLAMANSHSIHHRGQLAAYLRPMGSRVPSIYGGSADEPLAG
jgi:uncharacterized damage-inducible protein DinB